MFRLPILKLTKNLAIEELVYFFAVPGLELSLAVRCWLLKILYLRV